MAHYLTAERNLVSLVEHIQNTKNQIQRSIYHVEFGKYANSKFHKNALQTHENMDKFLHRNVLQEPDP